MKRAAHSVLPSPLRGGSTAEHREAVGGGVVVCAQRPPPRLALLPDPPRKGEGKGTAFAARYARCTRYGILVAFAVHRRSRGQWHKSTPPCDLACSVAQRCRVGIQSMSARADWLTTSRPMSRPRRSAITRRS